jgi:mono/diheme cytochrome c family protein
VKFSNVYFSRKLGRIIIALAVVMATACRQDMHDQPRYEPLEASTFFKDGRASRPQVPGTIARGQLKIDEHLYWGRMAGKPVETFPFPITKEILARGQQRYNIYCAPCHARIGDGNGIIVQRGMRQPPSFHIQRLREAPVGYYFDVVTNGFGAMYSYADRVAVHDRWAIVAYIRALQLSQNATLEDIPASQRQQLGAAR